LAGSTVSGNSASYRGGGIRSRNGNDGLSITDGSVISNNVANGHGGGIYSIGDASIAGSSITNNISRINLERGRSGGGGGMFFNGRSLTITGSDISRNSAASYGGGIFRDGSLGSFTSISDTMISNNSTNGRFGGIGLRTQGVQTFNNISVLNNSAGDRAGGFYLAPSGEHSVSINDSTISGNSSAAEGGGINLRYGPVSLQLNRTIVSGNSATNGAGIYMGGPHTLLLNDSTIADNESSISAGGIETGFNSTLSLANSTISDNQAGTLGGGINIALGSDVSIINSTISGNNAGTLGGGI